MSQLDLHRALAVDAEPGALTVADFRAFVDSQTWVFAKSMPAHPHWYVIRADYKRGQSRYNGSKTPQDAQFVAVVMFVRRHGVLLAYGRSWYCCYDLDGFRYWTMGDPIERTWVLNRAKVA